MSKVKWIYPVLWFVYPCLRQVGISMANFKWIYPEIRNIYPFLTSNGYVQICGGCING